MYRLLSIHSQSQGLSGKEAGLFKGLDNYKSPSF